MTLRSEIIGVQNLRPGEAIGYGGLYRTTQEQRIGIVACGYADATRGWRRAARRCWWMAYVPLPWDAYRWICWRSI